MSYFLPGISGPEEHLETAAGGYVHQISETGNENMCFRSLVMCFSSRHDLYEDGFCMSSLSLFF